MTLGELADRLGADLAAPEGMARDEAAARTITGLAGIETAGPNELTFVANNKYARLAKSTGAAALIVEPDFAAIPVPTLRIKNAYLAWARAIEIFHPAPRYEPGVHPSAVVAPTATIGSGVHIGACAVVGDHCTVADDAVLLPHSVLYPGVTVGERSVVHAHVVVRENCRIGADVILQNGVIIGGDGFGFARHADGRWIKIQQAGPVVVEDWVEVQANSCIDRASIGETRIAAGAKIDNLVQVGHGSVVGANSLLCAQVGLAGSSILGKGVILAGQVGVSGHLTMGDGSIATAQSGIGEDIAPGAITSGSPSMDNRTWLRMVTALPRLPDMMKRLRAVEAALPKTPERKDEDGVAS